MKTRYIKPSIAIVIKEELCSNGLTSASVHRQNGSFVDHFDVVEKDDSENQKYDWSKNAWGGD